MFDPALRFGFSAAVSRRTLESARSGTPNESVYPCSRRCRSMKRFFPRGERCQYGEMLSRRDMAVSRLLDESHRISQSVSTSTGSYWHGIMHRRERTVGTANTGSIGWGSIRFSGFVRAAKSLAEQASLLPETRFLVEQRQWDPHRFVDLCEASRTGKPGRTPVPDHTAERMAAAVRLLLPPGDRLVSRHRPACRLTRSFMQS